MLLLYILYLREYFCEQARFMFDTQLILDL